MAIPLRTRVFWEVYRRLELRPVMQQPADRVRAESDRRNRALALPGTWLITGRPDPRASITDESCILADSTELALRIYRPRSAGAASLPVIVYFHGGGYVSGSPRQSEWWCAGIAAQTPAVVVSVDYRLAPEHPFPGPPEDCYAATAWVADHAADLGADGTRLSVMGDSAGGNLAAVVSLMARDRGGPSIALQVLIYPSVDLGGEYPSKEENADAPILTRKDLDNAWRLYVPETSDPNDPYASPLFADHHDLPPALIQTAEHDPLRDQGSAYAKALDEAGVSVRLTNYVDAVHGYISLPNVTSGATQAMAEAVAGLRRALD